LFLATDNQAATGHNQDILILLYVLAEYWKINL